jgi:hypothetical protein
MITDALVESTAYDAAFWMTGVYDPSFPMSHLGEVAGDVSNKVRTLACYRLLADGNSDSFYHNLIRSGMVRRHYLRRCLEEGALDDHFRGCSRYAPLCDAITAGDFALAKSIVEVSPVEFLIGHEYEDDYCYGRILHFVISREGDQAPEVLNQFARYLEGSSNGRFQVAEALISKQQDSFDAAFDTLIQDRQNEIARNVERGEIESPPVIAARRVFIEGLAILKLAESLGLKTEQEYMFCPAIARVPLVKPFPGE